MEYKPRICLISPGWSISGGVRNLVEIGNGMTERGYPFMAICPDEVSPYYKIKFPYYRALAKVQEFKPDIVIATFFATCGHTIKLAEETGARFKGYLVQHDESLTYGDEVLWTYRYPWDFCVTISPWLVRFLKDFGQSFVGKFTPAYPQDIFKPYKNKKKNRVVFYSRMMQRKKTLIGLDALRIIKEEMPDVEIHTFDVEPRPKVDFDLIHHYRPFGEEIAKLYSSATVMMQSTPVEGYGTMSLEPLACGTAVVTPDVLGTEEFPEGTILYADVDARDIADKVMHLIKNEKERKEREKKGLEYAKTITWRGVVDDFERLIQDLLK